MATDGLRTTVLYIYGDLQWSGSEFASGTPAQVRLADLIDMFLTLPL